MTNNSSILKMYNNAIFYWVFANIRHHKNPTRHQNQRDFVKNSSISGGLGLTDANLKILDTNNHQNQIRTEQNSEKTTAGNYNQLYNVCANMY